VQDRDRLIASDPKVQAAMRGDTDSDSTPVGAIAGGTLGALAVLLLACLALGCFLMQRRKRSRGHAAADPKKLGGDGETALLRSYTLPIGGFGKNKDEWALQEEKGGKSSIDKSSGLVSLACLCDRFFSSSVR
jgi:hypothetical protein